MIMRDLLFLANNKKRKAERVNSVREFAVGMGIVAVAGVAIGILFAPKSGKEIRNGFKKKAVSAVETIKGTVQKKADMVNNSAAHIAQEVCAVIKDVNGKTQNIKKEVKDGYHEITQDIQKTAENISNELNKSVE